MFAVAHVSGVRRRVVSSDRARPRRAGRAALVVLLAAVSIGWIGDDTSAASPPAELVSVDPTTGAALVNDSSYSPSVSGDGSIVVVNTSDFDFSLNIVVYTLYVRNRANGTTSTIPGLPPEFASYPGTANGVVSRDGCHVVFWGRWYFDFQAGQWNIYSWNRCVAGSAPVDIADAVLNASEYPGAVAVSADGRYVAYAATPTSGTPKVARIDTTTSTENVLSLPFTSADSIDISDDGKFVAIGGQRPTAVGLPSYQVVGWTAPCAATCTTEVISVGSNGQPAPGYNYGPSVSADGRYVAFVSDTTGIFAFPPTTANQLLVRDRVAGVTKLVTDTPGQAMIPTAIGMGSPEISADGTQIAHTQTDSGETSEVWVARSTSGYFDAAVFDLVSYGVSGNPVGGPGAGSPSMSSTGRFVAFTSYQNMELSGGSVPDSIYQTWGRLRPIQLIINPTIDFGTVDVGSQSPAKTASIINTSAAEINIGGVTVPAGPFSITANTCVGVLPAGATCVVTMVFRPTAAGPSSSSLTVAGDGLSVSSSLSGTGRTPTGTPPTGPTPGSLKIAPISASYGSAVVGTALPAKKFVVSNPGQTAVPLASVTLGGGGADQFAIDSNGCTGSLAAAATCTIQVSATVTRDGSLTATLDVLGTGGQAAHATLRIGGEFTPTLKMNPGVVSAGGVTVAIGEGFPPNIVVELAFEGEDPFTTVLTKPDGSFQVPYLVLRNGVRIGGRQVVAVDQAQFAGVRAPLLIDLATYRPSGFSSPAITSGVRVLVTRGG